MASRHGVERADIMNMLALLLPGVALTYQVKSIVELLINLEIEINKKF